VLIPVSHCRKLHRSHHERKILGARHEHLPPAARHLINRDWFFVSTLLGTKNPAARCRVLLRYSRPLHLLIGGLSQRACERGDTALLVSHSHGRHVY
jgi:hypothetical protein